jgi:hypothetical protein
MITYYNRPYYNKVLCYYYLSLLLYFAEFSKWPRIVRQKDPSLPDDPFDTEGYLVLAAVGNYSG